MSEDMFPALPTTKVGPGKSSPNSSPHDGAGIDDGEFSAGMHNLLCLHPCTLANAFPGWGEGRDACQLQPVPIPCLCLVTKFRLQECLCV